MTKKKMKSESGMEPLFAVDYSVKPRKKKRRKRRKGMKPDPKLYPPIFVDTGDQQKKNNTKTKQSHTKEA